MSDDQNLPILDEDEFEDPALSKREWQFVSRINRVCVMASKSKGREDLIEAVKQEFHLNVGQASLLVRKAEEYMASGVLESADAARSMYHLQLNEIYAMCMANALRDHVEVTTKPTRVTTEDGKRRVVTATHTKVRTKQLDTSALQVAMRAADRMAQLGGVKGIGGGRGVNVGTMNVQVNQGAAASKTLEMANDQLASMIGVEIVDETRGREILSEQAEEDTPEAGHGIGQEDHGQEDSES